MCGWVMGVGIWVRDVFGAGMPPGVSWKGNKWGNVASMDRNCSRGVRRANKYSCAMLPDFSEDAVTVLCFIGEHQTTCDRLHRVLPTLL